MLPLLFPVAVYSSKFDFQGERENYASHVISMYAGLVERLKDDDVNAIEGLTDEEKGCRPVGITLTLKVSNLLNLAKDRSTSEATEIAFNHFQVSQKAKDFANDDDKRVATMAVEKKEVG